MLIVSILLYFILGSLFCLRFFKELVLGKLVIAFFLSLISVNILVVEILSLFHALDNAGLFLAGQTILSGLIALLLIDPAKKVFKNKIARFHPQIDKIGGMEIFLIVVIILILAIDFYVGRLIPINNTDSLHTHLPRIYYWIQFGSLANWNSPTDTQLYYPINLPIQGLWLFLLGGKETLFYLIQWFALLVSTVLVFEIARLLGAGKKTALVACLIGLSFPAALLQTFSYQGDLFIAAVLMSSVYFLLLFGVQKNRAALLISTLPLAIGLGSKQTAILFLPVYALAVLFFWVKKQFNYKTVLGIIGLLIAAAGIFSAYKYIQNYTEQDQTKVRKLPSPVILQMLRQEDFSRWFLATNLRYAYQIISLDGLNGRVFQSAQDMKNDAFQWLADRSNLDLESRDYLPVMENEVFEYFDVPHINEDTGWYGPLALIVIPLSILLVVFSKDSRRKGYAGLAILLLLVFYLALMSTASGWTNTSGRYFVFPTLALAPLTFVVIPKRQIWGNIVSFAIGMIAFYLALSSLLVNENRPIITQGSLYQYQYNLNEKPDPTKGMNTLYLKVTNRVIDDLALTSPARKSISQNSYYDNLFYQNTTDIPNIEFVNANLEPTIPLYLYIKKTTLEYALFGINKTRELIPVKSLEEIPANSYVLISASLLPEDNSRFNLVAENRYYSILKTQ